MQQNHRVLVKHHLTYPLLRNGAPPLPRFAAERTPAWEAVLFHLAQRLGGDVGLHLAQDLGRFRALQALDVVLVFQQNAQRVVDGLGIEVGRASCRERVSCCV